VSADRFLAALAVVASLAPAHAMATQAPGEHARLCAEIGQRSA